MAGQLKLMHCSRLRLEELDVFRLYRFSRTYRRGASGVNRHSDKHAPRELPEAQDAFKVLMIHWILQVARRIAFRCVLHRCGSQDIRR